MAVRPLSTGFELPTPQLRPAPVLRGPTLPTGSLLNFQARVDMSAVQGSFRFNDNQFNFYPTFDEFKTNNDDFKGPLDASKGPLSSQNGATPFALQSGGLKTRDAGFTGKRSKKSGDFCGCKKIMKNLCSWC